MEINSPQNKLIKSLRKLQRKREREQQQLYLIEGAHVVQEALKQTKPQYLLATKDFADTDWLQAWQSELIWISDEVAHALAETVTTQGIFAAMPLPKQVQPATVAGSWLLLDRVQDPGNIGTMVRTADAAGLTGVVLGTGSVDQFSPKLIRSMQGSQFHIQVLSGELSEWITQFKAIGTPVYGSELNPAAVSFRTIQPATDFALIMGNEGQGMSDTLLQQTTQNLFIPMQGSAESLNVAIAAGILLFQLQAVHKD